LGEINARVEDSLSGIRVVKSFANEDLEMEKFNRDSGITIVMISSELEELRQICDRIAIVSGGRIAGILPAGRSSEAFGELMVSSVV
jgi:ABC-type uncharacterized transport system ATPase subunit